MSFRTLLAHAAPYRVQLTLIVLLSLLGSLASLAIPWLAALVLGDVLANEETDRVLILTLLICALLSMTILAISSSLVSSQLSARILADFRSSIYAHVQSLPLGFHDQTRQGDLLALLSWEVARLSDFISSALASSISSIVITCGALAILFWIDPWIAVAAPIAIPAFYIVLKLLGRRLRKLGAELREAEAEVMSSSERNLQILPAIKAFACEDLERSAFSASVEMVRGLKVREGKINAILGPVIQLIAALAIIAIILFASRNLAAETMSATELFAFLFYVALLTKPVGTLADLYGQYNGVMGNLERLQSVLQVQPEKGYDAKGEIETCKGEISFEGVHFAYQGRDQTLRGINLDISAGEIVALTGDNGAGKTTIVGLMLGFYLPQKGKITLDSIDIQDLNLQHLRRQIGYVPQRPLLFNGTIRANICLGREGASERDIEQAAELAQAAEFIKDLPERFDTEVGDHGVRLSGGQRQRIALARALLGDPPILILDEATSMYDIDGEAAFVEACRSALSKRTVILITHRQASLALASRVFNLHKGQMTEVKSRTTEKQIDGSPLDGAGT